MMISIIPFLLISPQIAYIAYYEHFHHSFAAISISLVFIAIIVLTAASSIIKSFELKRHFVFVKSFDWS